MSSHGPQCLLLSCLSSTLACVRDHTEISVNDEIFPGWFACAHAVLHVHSHRLGLALVCRQVQPSTGKRKSQKRSPTASPGSSSAPYPKAASDLIAPPEDDDAGPVSPLLDDSAPDASPNRPAPSLPQRAQRKRRCKAGIASYQPVPCSCMAMCYLLYYPWLRATSSRSLLVMLSFSDWSLDTPGLIECDCIPPSCPHAFCSKCRCYCNAARMTLS